jgi:hypothetical protein
MIEHGDILAAGARACKGRLPLAAALEKGGNLLVLATRGPWSG